MQQLTAEHAESERSRAEKVAAAQQRRVNGGVAKSEEDIDDMRRLGSTFRTVPPPGQRPYSVADDCANMIERVKAAYPTDSVVTTPEWEAQWSRVKDDGKPERPVVKWRGGTDTKSYVRAGGIEAALRKLKELLADETRPWYHGAVQWRLSCAQQAEGEDQGGEGEVGDEGE